MLLRWTRIDPDGPGLHLPKRDGDVGYDLEAAETVELRPNEQTDVPTNIRLALPEGTWGEIRARSSVALRGLQVDAGVLDNGYTGPVFVLLRNMNRLLDAPITRVTNGCDWRGSVTINEGERIAQLVLHVAVMGVMTVEVEELAHDPRRGEAAFGSTGV